MTDLEQRLSARLHAEAAQLVPDTTVPRPLPGPIRCAASRWRSPVLAAAAVLVVAAGVTVAIQSQHGGSSNAVAQASPVLSSPTPAFLCTDTATLHAARVVMFRIGITADAFCMTADVGSSIIGSTLRPLGPLRSWVSSEVAVAGVVDPSVDRVVWVPGGTDEKSGTTVSLYSLGEVNGFAVPIQSDGTIVLYSGASEVAREQIPFPGAGPSAASSAAAATS